MVLGKCFDIQFPPPYFKLCEKYANYFKAEATVYLRQKNSITSYDLERYI